MKTSAYTKRSYLKMLKSNRKYRIGNVRFLDHAIEFQVHELIQ